MVKRINEAWKDPAVAEQRTFVKNAILLIYSTNDAEAIKLLEKDQVGENVVHNFVNFDEVLHHLGKDGTYAGEVRLERALHAMRDM